MLLPLQVLLESCAHQSTGYGSLRSITHVHAVCLCSRDSQLHGWATVSSVGVWDSRSFIQEGLDTLWHCLIQKFLSHAGRVCCREKSMVGEQHQVDRTLPAKSAYPPPASLGPGLPGNNPYFTCTSTQMGKFIQHHLQQTPGTSTGKDQSNKQS